MELDSAENYKATLYKEYPNQKISPEEILVSLIRNYGSVYDDSSTNKSLSLSEPDLDSILTLILGEGKEIFITCHTDACFIEKFICYYDTTREEVFIKLKKEK